MAEKATPPPKDLYVAELDRFKKFSSPPSEGNYSLFKVTAMSNGKIRFQISTADKALFGASLYPFELAGIEHSILNKIEAALANNVAMDDELLFQVRNEFKDFKTNTLKKVTLITGITKGVPFITMKDADNAEKFDFDAINAMAISVNGEKLDKKMTAIIYYYEYWRSMLSTIREVMLQMDAKTVRKLPPFQKKEESIDSAPESTGAEDDDDIPY